ncbi:hypothetical protein [Amycolatopsis sp. NPDC051071]|uniref:hypothetical protein n=1 Tax=Amycolatopsis sp. NPDC051071 TaxID=3154637 RepID=UPI0034415D7A
MIGFAVVIFWPSVFVTSAAVFGVLLPASAVAEPIADGELPPHAVNDSAASARKTAAMVQRMNTNPPAR